MTRIKPLLVSTLAFLGMVCPAALKTHAAEATFTIVLTDYGVEKDKLLVEALDLFIIGPKGEEGGVVRPSTANQVHDADKSTLTIETQYKGMPDGEFVVLYGIPSLILKNTPYREKIRLRSNDHFRKKLEFSTRKIVLKFQVDAKVREHIREDEHLAVSITKVQEASKDEPKTLEYHFPVGLGKSVGDERPLPTLWLIPDGEYVIEFAPVWGRPMRVPFRIADGKAIPELITFSDANRVPRPIE